MSVLSVTPSAVFASVASGNLFGTAYEEITAGQVVYLDTSTNKLRLAKADGANNGMLQTDLIGIALNHAFANQPLGVSTIDPDFIPGATLVKGETYAVNQNFAGGIVPISDLTASWYRCTLGIAKSTTVLAFLKNASGTTA